MGDRLPKRRWLGLVQVYTGNGKGKTTAALGLAVRASGHGYRVCFLQFMKGNRKCGEHLLVQKAAQDTPLFDIVCPNERSYFRQSPEERLAWAKDTFDMAQQLASKGEYDLIILDEIITAVSRGLLTLQQVLTLIKEKPPTLELVLTGRSAPKEIIEVADLVTEMAAVKHPFKKGIKARKGIEY